MAIPTFYDRIQETTTTTGTGTVTLAGAATGYQSFAIVGNGNQTYYCICDQSGTDWEVGLGTYTSSGTTLSRTTIYASSNSGSAVSFPAGTKLVFQPDPAVFLNQVPTGSGTTNYLARWTASNVLGIGGLSDDGSATITVHGAYTITPGTAATDTFGNTLSVVSGSSGPASASNGNFGANLNLTAGNGANSTTTKTAGGGGTVTITGGNGGSNAGIVNNAITGRGGGVTIQAGTPTPASSTKYGGIGGSIAISASSGATAPSSTGVGFYGGRQGGACTITAGAGGAGSGSGQGAGQGGTFTLNSGDGGVGTTADVPGAGGPMSINAGAGGSTVATGTFTGGIGGALQIQGGAGGRSTFPSAGGTGGELDLWGGQGGQGDTSGSGTGGLCTLRGGAAGSTFSSIGGNGGDCDIDGGSYSGLGVNGSVNIGTVHSAVVRIDPTGTPAASIAGTLNLGNTNATTINIGNSGSTTNFSGTVTGITVSIQEAFERSFCGF